MDLFKKQKKRLTPQEQVEFFDVIANFTDSGLSITEAIEAFQSDEEKGSYAYVLCQQILNDMRNGHPFSQALKRFPTSFPAFTTGVVAMAEGTGNFSAALQEISFRQEIQAEIDAKVSSATLVPKISAVFGFGVFLFASSWAIPKMGETLKSMDIDLPLITQVVMLFGDIFSSIWWLFILLAIGAYIGYKWFEVNHPAKLAAFVMRLPFWRPILLNRIRYDFCTIMGICLQAGIEPVQAMSFTAMASDNIFLKELINRALKHIKSRGTPFDEALVKEDAVPILDTKLYRMIKAGRRSSRTGEIMKKQADYYRKKLFAATATVGDKVGMLVIVPIYTLIIVMALAIVLPISSLAMQAVTKAF